MTDPNLSLVLDELENAKRKHPHFIDDFCSLTSSDSDRILSLHRERLAQYIDWKSCDFHTVLLCEVYEAMQAYAHGDLAHARQELAQCAAVCIRGMEYIEGELAKQHTTKETAND